MRERDLVIACAEGLPKGDQLTIDRVGGFGRPMLALFCNQDDDSCGINLDIESATKLRDWLTAWIDSHKEEQH